jgi:integrase
LRAAVIYENTARHITRRAVRPKELHLPDNAEFIRIRGRLKMPAGRFSKDCADLVRFLAYGGFRLGEAKNITWGDCDFKREEIIVRGDPEEGTKNSEIRRVPMIAEMRQLLEKLRRSVPTNRQCPRNARGSIRIGNGKGGNESWYCSFDPPRFAPFVCDPLH